MKSEVEKYENKLSTRRTEVAFKEGTFENDVAFIYIFHSGTNTHIS